MRILDVLNFSNRRNPVGDSGVRLQRELIQAICRKRKDFHFHLLVPRELQVCLSNVFDIGRVTLVPAALMSRQQGGARHLDLHDLSAALDLRRLDFDVLYINQPELAAPLLDFFNKVHFFDVHTFNYIHWMDWKRSDNVKNRWNVSGNLTLLTSILLSAVTGCNSAYGKARIVKEAARWFNDSVLGQIESKLQPLYPGVEVSEILSARVSSRNRVKTIIYPYRAQKYTGFKVFIDHLAKLWERRQDFRVVLTNPSNYDYIKHYPERLPFLEVRQLDRTRYLEELWRADIVAGCHTGASQWSLAVVEALAAECIPLLNSETFLPEMLGAALPTRLLNEVEGRYFYYRSEFPRRLEDLLDNLERERPVIRKIGKHVRHFYDWNNRVGDWIQCFELADDASPELVGLTKIARKLDRLMARNGSMSKDEMLRELDWHIKSRHISWTRYRKYLRSGYDEDLDSPEVTFLTRKSARSVGSRS